MDKLKVGIIGLGRLGRKYAEIIRYKIKNAQLIAVSSITDKELDYAQRELGIRQVYTDYRNLISLNELDAIFILSTSDQHARQIQDGLSAGLNIFCEKPMALNVSDSLKIIKAAEKKQSQTLHVGFMRRYDPSYKDAFKKLHEGLIGIPFMVRSQTVDKYNGSKFQRNYTQSSGGIFLDYNVHDIDLTRWFLGTEFKEVYARGGAFKLKEYKDIDDADFTTTTCTMENGSLANISASRIARHGHDTYTEIIGTEGSILIGRPSSRNRVEIYDQYGTRRECVDDFFERFESAFYLQIQDFVDSILDGNKLDVKLEDALEATRVAVAMTRSYLMDKIVKIDR